jgi:hypothetical protein
METLSVPRADLYTGDELVIVEWRVGDVQQQARFALVGVEDEDVDHDQEAVFVDLATLDGVGVSVDTSATIQKMPQGVLWLVDNFAAPAVGNADNGTDGREDERENGGAFA